MDVTTLTAAAIADLAFRKFIESGAGELAKKSTEGAIVKMVALRQKIWDKMQGNPTAEAALTSVEQGSKAELDRLVAYIRVAMDDDPQFADDIRLMAQQINAGKIQDNSSMTQNNYDSSTGYQTRLEGGTAFVGGMHYHSSVVNPLKESTNRVEKQVSAKKILILAANPKGTSPLRLDAEAREIEEGLRRSQRRKQFSLEQKWAVRPRDVQRAMLDVKPQIVQFSGHGADGQGLVLEDDGGKSQFVTTEALAGLFELFADSVECVILNACYSEAQATAISKYIPYVIGMSQEIGDRAAIEFAVGFYDAIGAGRSIQFAYRLACNAIHLAGSAEHLIPILKSSQVDQLHIDTQVSRVIWKIAFEGNFDDTSEQEVQAIVKNLQQVLGDTTLTLKKVEPGSIVLTLEGSEEGLKIIQTLFRTGQLTELMGLPIKSVEHVNKASTFSREIEVFFSYSHRDEALRDELITHLSGLKRQKVIQAWHDRQITAGKEWAEEIDSHFNAAQIILLLISSDFIASDYCYAIEMEQALKRHDAGEARVIPIILRPVDLTDSPFSKLQSLPKDAKPVTSWTNRDEAFLNIAQGIRQVARELAGQNL